MNAMSLPVLLYVNFLTPLLACLYLLIPRHPVDSTLQVIVPLLAWAATQETYRRSR